MDKCDTWKNSYRLVLAFLQEIDEEPHFGHVDLCEGRDHDEQQSDALWDVVFTRFSLLQEYGWHASLDELKWITDQVNDSLTEFNWKKLNEELRELKGKLTAAVIRHANDGGVFFDQLVPDTEQY